MSSPEKAKGFMGEFKAFIARGNVLDMAVGGIIGGAFGKISTSLVNDVIMPLISVLTGGVDFSNWKIVLKAAAAGAVVFERSEPDAKKRGAAYALRHGIEKILADYFYHKGIPYQYEKPLLLQGFGVVYPDFTFLSPRTRREIYWEHDGKMDDPAYAKSAVRKIDTYQKNGIYPGENLILTFETSDIPLNTRTIQEMVRRFLG